MQKMKSGVG